MPLRFTRITNWTESEATLRAIRTRVFIEEQGVPPELEWDAEDADAIHFLVKTSEDVALATARLVYLTPGRVKAGRFAVLPEYRRQGVASGLLRYLIGFARSQGVEEIELSAQLEVASLYEGEGFQREGEPYDEAGIPHIRMVLKLGQREALRHETLGSDERVHRFHSREEYLHHLIRLLQQARQGVRILSADLEKGILDDPRVLDELSRLAREQSGSRIQILVRDDRPPIQQSHQLLPLARRLPSSFDLRVYRNPSEFPEAVYVLVDQAGVLLRHHHAKWEGFCCYQDPGTRQRLQDAFERGWNQSLVSQEFRQLRL